MFIYVFNIKIDYIIIYMISKLKLKKIHHLLYGLFETIDLLNLSKISENEIIEEYDITSEILDKFKKKDVKWLNKTFKVIEKEFDSECLKNKTNKLDIDVIKNIIKYEFQNRHIYNYISELICGKQIDDKINDNKIDINTIKKMFTKLNINDIKNLRKWQINALKKIAEMGFFHCIFNIIMGAGKSIFELLLIEYHFRNILTNDEQQNATYIIVSSRKSILNQIFHFNDTDKQKNKFKKYKEFNQFNIDNFDNIIDLVNNKNLNASKFDNTKSNLVIINIQFLKSLMKEKNKDYFNKLIKNLKLIVFDECHNISAPSVYKFFKHIKQNTTAPIIGLSATPVRTQKKAREKSQEIFSKNDNIINIVYNFDMFEGIRTNTILPFKIQKYKFKGKIIKDDDDNSDNEDDTDIDDISEKDEKNIEKREKKDKKGFENIEYEDNDIKYNRELVKNILNNEIKHLPYRKGIGFCKDINSANEWKKYLKKNIKDIEIYITHSGNKEIPEEDQYDEFKNLIIKDTDDKINAFLIAVGKCSEGCDIDYLDYAICLDPIKNTDIVVMLQKFGRITRVDNENIELRKKKYALIFDTYIDDSKKRLEMTINTVITYYNLFSQNIDKNSDEYKERLMTLYKKTNFNNKQKDLEIRIKIDDEKNHDAIIIWNKSEDNSFEDFNDKFNDNLKDKLEEKIKNIMNDDNFLEKEYDVLRKKIQKYNKNNDKIYSKDEYKTYAKENSLEINPEEKYLNYGWINYYDFLGIKTDNYPNTLKRLKKILYDNKIRTEKDYYKYCDKNNLPTMPMEIYDELKQIKDLFD